MVRLQSQDHKVPTSRKYRSSGIGVIQKALHGSFYGLETDT